MTFPRIVSLLSSATEIICALGLERYLLAISHECDFPRSVATKPRATVSHIDSSRSSEEIDVEVKRRLHAGLPLYGLDESLLRDLEPDLIVTQAQCDVCAIGYDYVLRLVSGVPELSHTKVLALSPNSVTDILRDVLRVGEAVGTSERAREYAAALESRVQHIASLNGSLDICKRPRVVCIEWVSPLMTAGNWTPELIDLAGGTSGLAIAHEHSSYVSWQQIAELDPEVLLVAPCGFDLRRSEQEAGSLPSLPGWSSVAAVQAGRVFVVDGNALLNRSGPRIVDSLELLAHLLHPARFPAPGGLLSEQLAWSRLLPR
ncbi:MAG: cobalamin-binding protein [Pirellulaceae bacterium]